MKYSHSVLLGKATPTQDIHASAVERARIWYLVGVARSI
jgi:hypothetical protein